MVWNTATTSPKRIPAQRHKNIFKRSEQYQYDIQQMQFKGQGFDSSNPNSTPAAAQRPPSVAVEFGTRRSSGLQSYAPSEHRLSLRIRVGAGLSRRGRCVTPARREIAGGARRPHSQMRRARAAPSVAYRYRHRSPVRVAVRRPRAVPTRKLRSNSPSAAFQARYRRPARNSQPSPSTLYNGLRRRPPGGQGHKELMLGVSK